MMDFSRVVDYCYVFYRLFGLILTAPIHSLQRIYWSASDVMLNFSKSAPMKKETPPPLGRPESKYIFSTFSFLSKLFLSLNVVFHFCVKQSYKNGSYILVYMVISIFRIKWKRQAFINCYCLLEKQEMLAFAIHQVFFFLFSTVIESAH